MHKQKKTGSARAGFTLTEIAIVLGIIGSILGAIWVAYQGVMTNFKLERSMNDAQFIFNKYRSVYPTITGSEGDITCIGLKIGAFPADMVSNLPCTTGTLGTYPVTPWAGQSVVEVSGDVGGFLKIGFYDMSQAACVSFAKSVAGLPGVSVMIVGDVSAGTNVQYFAPALPTLAQIGANCGASQGNEVAYEMAL